MESLMQDHLEEVAYADWIGQTYPKQKNTLRELSKCLQISLLDSPYGGQIFKC
jgi:hypothetical protein